jgi:LysR family transcriptional activator of nhaA
VQPRIIGEVEDSALLKALGAEGHGIFCAPSTVAREVAAMYGLAPIGETREIIERFYAITVERRIKNEVVGAISEVARTRLFA